MSNLIDVGMRSKNNGRRVLQTVEVEHRRCAPWAPRLNVIDSGVTDGSLGLCRELKVERIVEISCTSPPLSSAAGATSSTSVMSDRLYFSRFRF